MKETDVQPDTICSYQSSCSVQAWCGFLCTQQFNEETASLCVCDVIQRAADSAELSCSVRALQQDLEELKSVNISLRKENHSLREQLNTARNGNEEEFTPRLLFMTSKDWMTFLISHTSSPFSLCVRWGECAWSLNAAKLRCRVRSISQGFLPQHDVCPGSAAAPAQIQAQCTYPCPSAASMLVSSAAIRPYAQT